MGSLIDEGNRNPVHTRCLPRHLPLLGTESSYLFLIILFDSLAFTNFGSRGFHAMGGARGTSPVQGGTRVDVTESRGKHDGLAPLNRPPHIFPSGSPIAMGQ